MLKFNKPEDFDRFYTNKKPNIENYITSELLPAIKKGKWSELDKMPVLFNTEGQAVALFKDDKWDFKDSGWNIFSIANLNFTDNGLILEYNLKNQIKCMILMEIYVSRVAKGLMGISQISSNLKRLVKSMTNNGLNDFSELSSEALIELVDKGLTINKEFHLTGLNNMLRFANYLPFQIPLETTLSLSKLNLTKSVSEQHQVIPPRIYMGIMSGVSKAIEEAYPFRNEVSEAISELLEIKKSAFNRIVKKIRTTGDTKYIKDDNGFLDALESENINLRDNEASSRWLEIFHEKSPTIDTSNSTDAAKYYFKKNKIKIGSKVFNSASSFNNYLFSLEAYCKFACLLLSGMRKDELSRMSTNYGSQKVVIEGQVIYLLTTKQSKITGNSQTKDDTFVTTETGYKAFEIIKALMEPKYPYMKEKSYSINITSRLVLPIKKLNINNFSDLITRYINKSEFIDMHITQSDMEYINHSDPKQTKYQVGDKYEITCHQTRRSFAFYLVGYELLSFPQLKQQLSHFSMAMTRWYARNAASFKKMYTQIAEERVVQQAEIWTRVMNKMANNERIAGGKGKAMLAELAKQGANYFNEGDDRRSKLSKNYWINEIKSNRHKIHAIAPGMYCTSQGCKMRINIDLSECVDCDFDFIEDAVYAESSRINAMRSISYAIETGELNKSLASKYIMQIRSAEKIMTDIKFEFEAYEIPTEISSLLITTLEP
ncbi:integrase [uncultured Pseudoalteromonas sp.]|uniref:integrase n=1 Tax=uncultured Pseudoalteromonas sp. TaxID=114053 RepID=UPI000C3759F0|nr:integrase [uncultured Pseudoalteromonas sp.]MBD57036.1 integrase [Pseudoalteromonas sp.]|tara:strand:- start:197 stop:2341 length:2145 start_codon:yes stop_codon:yes gene_type:complete